MPYRIFQPKPQDGNLGVKTQEQTSATFLGEQYCNCKQHKNSIKTILKLAMPSEPLMTSFQCGILACINRSKQRIIVYNKTLNLNSPLLAAWDEFKFR